jgi:uncharacterized membrane protein
MTRESRLVAIFLAAASLTVLASAVLVTHALADGAPEQWRLPFRLVCHGMVERAFSLGGVGMPICARCTAIWVGLFAGAAAFPLVRRAVGVMPLGALLVLVVPLAVDGATQAIGLRESTNLLRGMTGLIAGTAFAIWALAAIDRNARQRAEGP